MSEDIGPASGTLGLNDTNNLVDGLLQPSTPQDLLGQDLSQVTLPSTEVPGSPMEPSQSFSTQSNDDDFLGPNTTVIPSSLTPPPSTQVEQSNLVNGVIHGAPSHSQPSLVSPPATVGQLAHGRDATSGYLAPEPQEVLDASTEELRVMLQSCILEQQKLKAEAAHHRLQFNLLKLHSDDDAKRAEVECDMLRREIEALRTAEHAREAKRELSTFSEAVQVKYQDMKTMFEGAMDEVDILTRRLKAATKIIQQKDDELLGALEEREQLLTRIRENREHMNKLCSPGGIFHNAFSPTKHTSVTSPVQTRGTPRQTNRSVANESGHRLSTLLEVLSQDNKSAPSTPMMNDRPVTRATQRHQRNSQSMSSLPTTPINKAQGHGLLPSAHVVPMTEPQKTYHSRYPDHEVHTANSEGRKSRESTISVDGDDAEEIARQALKSVQDAARRSFALLSSPADESGQASRDPDVQGRHTTQTHVESFRRDVHNGFDNSGKELSSERLQKIQRSPAIKPAARLLSNLRGGSDKRKFSGQHESRAESRSDHGSPPKRSRVGQGDREL